LKLRIAETFASVQGEGIWVGVPSTFIRVSGCNLRCVWCDTPYASWNPEGDFLEESQIVEIVESHGLRHVVITGGEPMLFDPIESLTRELKRRGRVITIETAGTVYREIDCDLMSISPKLANSTPPPGSGWAERHEQTRLDRAPLAQLLNRYDCQLKFVVNPESGDDLAEIDDLLRELPDLSPDRILLMAEGTDAETLTRRSRLLVAPCLERNWRLTPRFHVELFGNTKGT
jgi:7-carboxy-7-deazaguanine synthase